MQQMLGPMRYAYTDLTKITSHFRDRLGQGALLQRMSSTGVLNYHQMRFLNRCMCVTADNPGLSTVVLEPLLRTVANNKYQQRFVTATASDVNYYQHQLYTRTIAESLVSAVVLVSTNIENRY
jgi:hypothetical protein